MAASSPQVQVVGLRALSRDLAKMGATSGPLLKAMRQAGAAAAEPVAAVTRSSLPQVSGRLAGDVRVTATRTGAGVRMGRSSIRYAGWVEFGGRRRVPVDSARDYNPRGRYLFPHAVQLAARSAELYAAAVTEAVNQFHWTNQTADEGSVHE
jgi:hypothetical protein